MAGRDALTTTDRKAALRRQTIHPLESRQRFAPAAMDRLGPLPHARRLATRPRPLPDAEIAGGEVSWRRPLQPLCGRIALLNTARDCRSAKSRSDYWPLRVKIGHCGDVRCTT